MDVPPLALVDPTGVADVDGVAATIEADGWTIDPERPQRLRRTFLDTVDGRLLGRGRVLEREQRSGEAPHLLLRERASGTTLADAPLGGDRDGDDDGIRFAWDLPAGRLADQLRPVLDVRAVLPFAAITTRRRVIGVRNRQAKLVARVVIDDDLLVASGGVRRRRPLGRSVRVVPLRGYEREAARVSRLIVEQAGLTPVDGDVLGVVLERLDRPPATPAMKSASRLEPDGPAIDAAASVLRALLDTIEANVKGTLDELDTEFLHDLRVSVRRTRSGLKAFPGIFRPAPLARFAPGFGWVQQATGAARDLDVQLLEFDVEVRKLPAEAAAALRPLQHLLESRHVVAHRETNRALRSVRFRRLLERWRSFLDAPPPGPDANRPIVDVASERIWRAYRRVVKPGRAITASSPAEELHDLRKRGKELRYLLEFFSGLYVKDQVATLVGELKALQDNLGSFQDDQVQAAELRAMAAELHAITTTPETLIALGQLVAHHDRTSHEARAEFAERFARFDRPANREQFALLFRPVAGPPAP